jgi:hypothetical protein
MKLTDAQLTGLRLRCIRAASKGYIIAQVDRYLDTLAEEIGFRETPFGVRKGSAEHLQALVEEALKRRAGGEPTLVEVEVKVEPSFETKVIKEPEPKAKPYEEWYYEDLRKEAQNRNITGRSNMSKGEIVHALYEDDLESEEEDDTFEIDDLV